MMFVIYQFSLHLLQNVSFLSVPPQKTKNKQIQQYLKKTKTKKTFKNNNPQQQHPYLSDIITS